MSMKAGRGERGVALTETVLMMSFILLVLYGMIETGMASYYQVSADGATFVGAHTAVQNDPDGSGNAATFAATVANNVFRGIGQASVKVLHPTSTTFETDVSFSSGNFGLPGHAYAPITTSREVEAAADPNDDNASVMFPPAGTEMCIVNAVNNQTGSLSKKSIAGFTPGGLTTTVTSAPGSLPGSLAITPTTISGSIGNVPGGLTVDLGKLGPAQMTLSMELAALSSAINGVSNDPLIATIVNTSIAGTSPVNLPSNNPVLSTSVIGLLSGTQGFVADAEAGTLSSAQLAMLQGLIGSTIGTVNTGATTIIGRLNAAGVGNDPAVMTLENVLSQLSPDLSTLDGIEAQIDALDATTATACP